MFEKRHAFTIKAYGGIGYATADLDGSSPFPARLLTSAAVASGLPSRSAPTSEEASENCADAPAAHLHVNGLAMVPADDYARRQKKQADLFSYTVARIHQ
jgi:hypothetical protein